MDDGTNDLSYGGTGEAGEKKKLPPFEAYTQLTSPAGYLADPGLSDAVNVALIMGQPLLITGEPGTGKTQLAASIAHEFEQHDSLPTPLFTFHTKSTSSAKDVFYFYDALRHFRDATTGEKRPAEEYISYEALGLAILLSLKDRDHEINERLPREFQKRRSLRSVVLIDEIDKAPRDLPNDLLNEFENMTFTVNETRRTFQADQEFRPVLILTSNSEKDLPDAFLRRCIFYHIDFPSGEKLKEIVKKRLGDSAGFKQKEQFDAAIGHFEAIRKQPLKKKPATAELLLWLRVLEKNGIDVDSDDEQMKRKLASSYSLLAKYKDDRNLLRATFIGGPIEEDS
jgi:MoxR-like ATPase